MNVNLTNRFIVAAVIAIAALLPTCGHLTDPEGKKPPQETLDQFCLLRNGDGGLEITVDQPVIQTFTVGLGGQLTRIVIPDICHHRCKPTYDLIFELVLLDTTAVLSPNLARMEFPPDSIASFADSTRKLEINLRSYGIMVTPGEVLGIRFSSFCPGVGCTYAWSGEFQAYDHGEAIINGDRNLRDMVFETYVLPR